LGRNSIKSDVGKKRRWLCGAFLQIANHLVDEKLRGIEALGHACRATILEPVHLIGQAEIALRRIPVVRAGITLNQRPVKTTLVRQVVGLIPNIPFAGHVGSVTARAQQLSHGDHVAIQATQVTRLACMLVRHRLTQIAHAGQMIVDPGEQHRARR
jgi:hypothetical protein